MAVVEVLIWRCNAYVSMEVRDRISVIAPSGEGFEAPGREARRREAMRNAAKRNAAM